MYKIYHNDIPVFLTTPAEAAQTGLQAGKSTYLAAYTGKKKMLRQYLDLLDKTPKTEAVLIHATDLEGLWADFQACFKVLEAAGGYVLNDAGELLVFFRRDSWDMPKGKIDPGETPEQAAVREVQEETGLVNVRLGDFLAHTYHTYDMKGKRILKKTWWYRMTTPDTMLVPQVEEDIEEIRWVKPKAWLESGPAVYANLLKVIEMGMSPA